MERVWQLTHDEYVRMEYARPRKDRFLRHFALDGIDETTVWIAEDLDERILGTISLTADGPAGLHVDEDFKDVADLVREECRLTGKKLAASWRIVTRHDYHHQMPLSMGLIAAVVDAVRRGSYEVTLYTFNPRHEKFYRRMLGFKTIAGPRPSPTVENAPAILMRGDLPEVNRAWGRVERRRSSARLRRATSDTREYQPV
jgi:hypothetical protein